MPDRSKVRWSQLKVGVVGLSAAVIVFALVFLLTSSKGGLFQHNALLRTFMDDASGIADGSVVRLNGFTVGYLDGVILTTSRDPKRAVEFDMRVQEKYLKDIPVDSVAGISAANLLGDKFINITKGQDTQTVRDGAELKSLQGQDIPELMAQTANFLQSFQTIVNRLDALLRGVEEGKGNIGLLLKDDELYNRVNGIAGEMQKLLSDVRNSNGTFSKLIHDDDLYQEMRAPLKRLDAILADIQSGQGTIGKALKDPGLYDDFRKTVGELNGLLADLNAGKGTAGKLLKDEQLHKRVDDLVAKFNGILDKMTAGQGTLGQFLVNPELYQSLTETTREFQGLAKDMRANPKKFLTMRLTLFLTPGKQLVVNADDFGFTPDVNAGIVEGHRRGILTATTLMANGAAFEDAVRLAREAPTLDVGCHLVLVSGRSLSSGKPLPSTLAQLLAALARREIRIYEELAAQVRAVLDAGIRPTHLDTHKHTHLAPPVLDAVARLSQEFAIPWVRRPFDFPLTALRGRVLLGKVPRAKRLTSDALGLLRRRFHRVLEKHGCRTTDHFAGFQITGRFRTAELVDLLGALPAGTTELMCHPGRCGEALRNSRTRLKESREHELEALLAPEVRQALMRNGIKLVSYREL